jgi:hypothetical protein
MDAIKVVDIVWTLSTGLVAVLSGFVVFFLKDIATSVRKLNSDVAVIINELTHHDKRISKLESIK